jgi:glutamyl-Q tRNA(Asp) synthetase
MNSTPRQIWLQDLLGYSNPTYGHIPLAVSADGQKLSKSQGAAPVNCDAAALALFAALEFLNQSPPAELRGAPVETLWQWAIGAWDIHRMQGKTRGFAAANLDQTPKFQQVKKP